MGAKVIKLKMSDGNTVSSEPFNFFNSGYYIHIVYVAQVTRTFVILNKEPDEINTVDKFTAALPGTISIYSATTGNQLLIKKAGRWVSTLAWYDGGNTFIPTEEPISLWNTSTYEDTVITL